MNRRLENIAMKTTSSLIGRGLLLGMLAIALLPTAALAAGENYGRIAGYVFDTSGNPLAEIQVTATGPAMPQPQVAVTNTDGRFEIATLIPGEGYSVQVESAGFRTQKQTGISVLLGQATQVDFALEVLGDSDNSETVVVVGKANPALNPDSAQTGAVMSSEKAVTTPIFTQVQALPQLIAGVGVGNAPSTRGGLSRYGKQYVDGMETSDISDGSISAPLNFYAVDQFEIMTGGFDAQYNSLGLVQNVVTKSGSNRFTYDATLILSPSWANAGTQFASRQPVGVGTLLSSTTPQAQTSFYSPILNLGGPIIKDRLWFYASGQFNFSNKETPLGDENRPTGTETRMGRLKLTWQPSSEDRLSLALNLDRNAIDNNLANTSTALNAEQRIRRGGFFLIANYDRTINENARFELQAGMTSKDSNTGPMPDAGGIAQVNTNSGGQTQFGMNRISSSREGNYLIEAKKRFQLDPTLHWRLGSHSMKGGVQLGLMTGTEETGVYGGRRYVNRGPICDESDPTTFGACNTRQDFFNTDDEAAPQVNDGAVQTTGLFLQDRWNVNRQLTLIAGLRFDQGRLYGVDGNYLGRMQGFGPRLSASYDLFADRSTLLKAHYGRSNDVGDMFIAQQGNPSIVIAESRFIDKAYFPDCVPNSTTTGCTTKGGEAGVEFLKNQKAPYVDELSLGLHREVVSGLVVGVDGTYRRYANLWVDEEVNRIWDASGTRILSYKDGQTHTIYQMRTTNKAWRDYKGLDLWVQGKAGGFDLLASYTLAYNNGTVSGYFDSWGDNPRQQYLYEGPLPEDLRHNVKGSINYALPFGLDLGMRLQLRSGAPMWQSIANPADSGQRLYRSPRGTGYTLASNGQPDFTNPAALAELRQPDQFLVDLMLRYDLGRAIPMGDNRAEVMLQVFNALNSTAAWRLDDSWARSNSAFGQVTGRQSPLQAQLALRFRN